MKACIFGTNGQAGSYLAEFLLEKGYEVSGMIRRNSIAKNQTYRINHIRKQLSLHYGDMTDFISVFNILDAEKPDEVYNLAAQSHVKVSEELPVYTGMADAIGVINILECQKRLKFKLYQASSSEMFGNQCDDDGFQRETTPMIPVSPYGAAKLYAHNLCSYYRDAYKLFICCGILFNHESSRRSETFVTKKIVQGLVDIHLSKANRLVMGNPDACRDWGHAKDYIEAQWLMLQQPTPKDFVIATGVTRSVREFANIVLEELNLSEHVIEWNDDKYLRGNELHYLKGDSSLARKELGWKPKISFEEMVKEMIQEALKNSQ